MKLWAAVFLLPVLASPGPSRAAPNTPPQGAPAKPSGATAIPANDGTKPHGHDEGTIEITADHAVAKRGAVTLMGDTLVAYYRPLAGTQKPAAATGKPGAGSQQGLDTGNTEIWRVVAEGHVHIVSGERDAWGDRAEYDKDKSVVVLTGKALKASTFTDVVTARDSLEYWQDRDMAVARGDALIVRVNGNTLAGDVIAGNFVKDAQGQSSLKTIAAKGHVVVTTLTDIVHGDEGAYDLDSKRTVLFGNVKATKGNSELEGQSAEVNMETGISQVFPGPGQRVHALIVRANSPQSGPPASPAPASPPPTAAKH
jgi:lipopolysaccharide export system protein LptA